MIIVLNVFILKFRLLLFQILELKLQMYRWTMEVLEGTWNSVLMSASVNSTIGLKMAAGRFHMFWMFPVKRNARELLLQIFS